jgi:hypothetical protein
MEKKKKKVAFTPLMRSGRDKNIRYYGFDIETYSDKNTFMLVCIANSTESFVYRDDMECINALLHDKKFADVCLIATNLKFDFYGLMQRYLIDIGAKQMHISERNGHYYKCVLIRPDKKIVEFRDTTNFWLQGSVVKLGDAIGIKKLSPPFTIGSRMPQTDQEWKDMVTYCTQDALISCVWFEKFILTMCDQWHVDVPYTAASMALKIFQTNFLTLKYSEIADHETWKFLRKGYYGGNTQVFRRGICPVKVDCYDFNSSYPASMATKEYPDPHRRQTHKKTNLFLINHLEGISYVEGWMPDTIFAPVLPSKMRGKLEFPTGYIRGCYTHVELRQAIKDGFVIHKFGQGVSYVKKCSPFQDFIETFYNKRLELKAKKDPMENMYKILLNSSYGKFGFNYMEENSLVCASQIDEEMLHDQTTLILPMKYDFFSIRNENNTDQCKYALMEWAAYITAYARLHLFEFIRKHEKYLLYVDTDSLYLMEGHDPVENEEGLGAFKYEKSCEPNESCFVAPKHYRFSNDIKIKGVGMPKLAKDKSNLSELNELWDKSLTGKPIKQRQFSSPRKVLRSKSHHKHGELSFNEILEMDKILNVQDTKRKWETNTFDPNRFETSRAVSYSLADWKRYDEDKNKKKDPIGDDGEFDDELSFVGTEGV